MNPNKKLLATVALALSCSSFAATRDGAISGGGGQGVTDAQGQVELRELVEGVSCDWMSGRQLQMELEKKKPESQFHDLRFMLKFFLGNPGFNSLLERETLLVNVCMSRFPLQKLPEKFQDAIAAFDLKDIQSREPSTVQLAIRIGNEIYIDASAFQALSDETKDYLFYHELLHSYIPMGTTARMLKLRNMTALTYDLAMKAEAYAKEHGFTSPVTFDHAFTRYLGELHEKFQRGTKDNSLRSNWGVEEADLAAALLEAATMGRSGDVSFLLGTCGARSDFVLEESGRSVFLQTIEDVRRCTDEDVKDPRCSVDNMGRILRMLARSGGDANSLFDNGEGGQPVEAWKYMFLTSGRGNTDLRAEYGKMLFYSLLPEGAGPTPELQVALDALLLRISGTEAVIWYSAAVKTLVEMGAEINARDDKGWTPLHYAAAAWDMSRFRAWYRAGLIFREPKAAAYLETLVKAGADKSLKTPEGETALDLFLKARYPETEDSAKAQALLR